MAKSPTPAMLRREIQVMGEMIEGNVDTALMALIDRNLEMAQAVIRSDAEIDELENAIHRTCHSLLRPDSQATRGVKRRGAPLSDEDFRFVVASMKIAIHLERIADLSVDIARSVSYLVTRRSIQGGAIDLSMVIETAEQMVRDSVACLVQGNAQLAWKICVADDLVDAETQRLHNYLVSLAQDEPEKTGRAVHLLYVVRSLERIADQATNIAEEVIFTLEGKVVRHHIEEYRKQIEEQWRKAPSATDRGQKKVAAGRAVARTRATGNRPAPRRAPAHKRAKASK